MARWLPFLAFPALAVSAPGIAQLKTHNVVLIVSDGLRWQEIFTGADPALLNEEHGGIWESEASLRKRFWNDDPKVRRRMLFPFLWDVVAKHLRSGKSGDHRDTAVTLRGVENNPGIAGQG